MQLKLSLPQFIDQTVFGLALLLAGTASTYAQDQSEFKLGASSAVTFSDNVKLSSTNKQSGTTLRVEPTLSWHRDAAVLKADVDLGVAAFASSADHSNSTQTRLNAALQGNFLQKTLLLDLNGQIAEQSSSIFNPVTPNGQADTTNSLTQTRYLSAGATYRNRLFTDWGYNLNYKTAYSEDSKNITADTRTQNAAASIGNRSAQKILYTELRASGNYYEPKNLTSYKTGISQLEVGWRPMTELTTFVSGGEEYNGYLTENRTSNIYDGGFSWRPNKHTSFDASAGHRFYGNSHSARLSYSTAKSWWGLSKSKVATHTHNEFSGTGVTALSAVPSNFLSPSAQAALAAQNGGILPPFVPNALLAQLGLVTNLADSYSLDETLQLNIILFGARNSISFSAFRKDTSIINSVSSNSAINSNFSLGDKVRQDGASIDWNHKLDLHNSIGAGYVWLHSRALTGTNDIITKTLNLNYQYQINKKTSSGLTLRHYLSSSMFSPDVTENAIIGTIRTEF